MPRDPFADLLDLDAPSRASQRRKLPRFAPEDLPPEESGWESVLRTAGLLGYGARNVLTGNLEGAGRNLVDLATSPVRALLPGSQAGWELSRRGKDGQPGDYTEGSDLLREWGIADLKPGIGKLAADIGVGLVTDPLTYLGVGPAAAAAKAGATAAKGGAKALTVGVPFSKTLRTAIPGSEYLVEGAGKAVSGAQGALKRVAPEIYEGLAKTAAGTGKTLRRLGGSLRVASPWRDVLDEAAHAGGLSRAAQEGASPALVEGLTPDQGRAVFYAFQDAMQTPEGVKSLGRGVGQDARVAAADEVLARMGQAPQGAVAPSITDITMPVRGSKVAEEIDPLSLMLGRQPQIGKTAEEIGGLLDRPGNYPLNITDPRMASGTDVANRLLTNPVSQQVEGEAFRAYMAAPMRVGETIVAGDRNNVGTIIGLFDDVARVQFVNKATGATAIKSMPIQSLRKSAANAPMDVVPDIGKTAKGLGTRSPLGAIEPAALPDLPSSPGAVIAGNAARARPPRSVVDPISEMMGAKSVYPEAREGAYLASPLESTAMQSGGLIPELAKTGVDDLPGLSNRWGMLDDITSRVEANLAKAGVQIPREKIAGLVKHGSEQFREWTEAGVLQRPQGRDLLRETSQYLQRTFVNPDSAVDDVLRRASGGPSATSARVLENEDVAGYLARNPGVKLEDDLGNVLGGRGAQQARGIERATLAKGLVSKYVPQAEAKLQAAQKSVDNFHSLTAQDRFKAAGLSDAEVAALEGRYGTLATPEGAGSLANAANKIIEDIAKTDPESAEAIMNMWRGLEPRGPILEFISKGNRLFKRAATAGAVVPRLNFLIRNATTGGGGQLLANEATRPVLGKYIKDLPGIILRSLDDGIERLFGGRIGNDDLADIRQALKRSGGRMDQALALVKDPLHREALANGVVTGGFGDAELLSKQMGNTGWKKKWNDLMEWPSEMASGMEQRMRLSAFKGMRQKFPDMPVRKVASDVKETFFDYRPSTALNRNARDVIPFFQFTAKAIPQTLKLLKEQPSLAGAIRPLYSQDTPENPIYPYLADQPVVPLGDGDYLTSFGLPFEVLGNLPNPSDDLRTFGEQIRRGVVGQSQPMLKTAYSMVSGKDPSFDSPWLGYDKTPAALRAMGAPENSELGRIYNAAAGTGLIQPLVSSLNAVGGAVNPDVGAGGRALSTLTGLRVVDVDKERAMQQLLDQYLSRRPDVRQRTSYYKSDDEEVARVLRLQADLAKQAKKRREQAARQ
jgi:hypothetical protein